MSIHWRGLVSWDPSFFARKGRASQKSGRRTSPSRRLGPALEVERLEERTLLSTAGPAIPSGPAGAATLAALRQERNLVFLQQVYKDLLHRSVDPGGQTAWVALLNAGVPRTTVVTDIETSPSGEYQTDEVNQAYELLLHRPADPSGLQTGLYIVSHFSLQAEYAFIAGSQEYRQNRGGGTIDGWLNAIYQDALNRAVDSGGQSAFSQALSSGAKSFQQAADIIFTSPEYYQDLVASDFVAAFGYTTYISTVNNVTTTVTAVLPPVGEPAQAFWVSQLQSGQTPEQIVAGILGAPNISA
jgi:hypothetical protein